MGQKMAVWVIDAIVSRPPLIASPAPPGSGATCGKDNTQTGRIWERRTDRFAIRSDRTELNRSVRFEVRRYFWYIASNEFHGRAAKKLSSSCRASSQVIPFFSAVPSGCLTQYLYNHLQFNVQGDVQNRYQLLTRGSISFRMSPSQLSSSPGGMRSGFVRTPNIACWSKVNK
jgi:hypothetical protein